MALTVLNMLNPRINSLGKNLARNSFVYRDARSTTSDVDTSRFAMVTLTGHFCLDSTHPLDVYNSTLLVAARGRRDNSTFPKKPGEHTMCALPLPLRVRLVDKLLDDGRHC